jgi:hypothetical protein
MPEPTTDKPQDHPRAERVVISYEAAISPDILLPGLEHLEYDELFDRYRQSPFGLHHAKQTPRYAQRYTYDHSRTLIDLGDDVHPVEHMQHTHDAITQPFVIAQAHELTPREVVVMRLGTFLHDMGECTHPQLANHGELIGDTAYGEKLDGEETNEQRLRRHIVQELWPEVPADLLVEIDEMIMDPDSKLGHMFNTIERLGYLETGLNAAKVIKSTLDTQTIEKVCEQPYDRTRVLQLSLLHTQVANIRPESEKPFQQHYSELTKRREEYRYIDQRMAEIDEGLKFGGREYFGRIAIIRTDLEAFPHIKSFDTENIV